MRKLEKINFSKKLTTSIDSTKKFTEGKCVTLLIFHSHLLLKNHQQSLHAYTRFSLRLDP